MSQYKLILNGFVNVAGVAVYVSLVSLLMRYAGTIVDKVNNYIGPVLFLLLFVLSAAVTGGLVLGRPILLYIDGQKSDGVKLFLYTLGWLFVFIVGLLVGLILLNR